MHRYRALSPCGRGPCSAHPQWPRHVRVSPSLLRPQSKPASPINSSSTACSPPPSTRVRWAKNTCPRTVPDHASRSTPIRSPCVSTASSSKKCPSPSYRWLSATSSSDAMTRAALLLLADGRFPSGGHAHSAGTEAACATGGVVDGPSLQAFAEGRLHSTGRVDAAFAAAACSGLHPWAEIDGAYEARTASPRLRAVSRSLGRQLLRSGQRVWPSPVLDSLRAASPAEGAHHPLALGAVARAAQLDE